MELIIKNGTVVTAKETYLADVGVAGGKIVAIAEKLEDPEARVIDATGKYVMPGIIDGHVHLALPFGGTVSADDFSSGTKAAAFGGVTTIVDFAIQMKGESLADAIARRRAEADGKVCIDYGLHVGITDAREEVLREIPEVISNGCPTFKLFMTYDAFVVDDGTLLSIIEKTTDSGGMVGVHAENHKIIGYLTARLLSEGKTAPQYHAVSRPDWCEAEATSRAIRLAEAVGGKLYIFHLTCSRALDEVVAGRERGMPVYAETCPQYLLLTADCYLEPDFGGAKYVMSPPLRTAFDNEALWKGLRDGYLQVVGSDHCPFTMEQKKLGLGDFTKIPNGAPGVETTLPLLYSEGVLKGRISLNRMVEVLSTNPACLFGLPNKGSLAVGYDADIVIFDPDKEVVLSYQDLHMCTDYSPYEGLRVKGYPVTTISRGRVIVENGIFTGDFTHGRFVARRLPQF
ncbi:dihydropyrimidinase [Thermatribacter velox]|uniref:Dihydropyrimidinase n=1 Tax=Thermatribacter velox TaxID=3039681 RepID=A0ABZ2YBS7_9BACT